MRANQNFSRFSAALFFVTAVLLSAGAGLAQNPQTADKTLENVKYVEMTDGEKRIFIKSKANEILSLFRRVDGDEITAANVDRIKLSIDSYVRRRPAQTDKSNACRFGDDLFTLLKRGSVHAPAISESFAAQNLPAQTGIYLAMTESEFCPCIQSPTGALGMFQLTKTTATLYGLNAVAGASPASPDDRCKPEAGARAAASYINQLLNNDFGRNSIGFPLSIAAYNTGEGSVKVLLRETKAAAEIENVTFWILSDHVQKNWGDKFYGTADENESSSGKNEKEIPARVKLFLSETGRYVPKFFAAAIIGENPETFGISAAPLSKVKAK